MKTPSPIKSVGSSPTGLVKGGALSPDGSRLKAPSPGRYSRDMNLSVTGRRKSKLSVMGHSMISRSGDPESEVQGLNCDLRLITGRMAQTLETYEGKQKAYVNDQIRDVEQQLQDIQNPILQVQVKLVLDDYKSLSEEREMILGNLEEWFNNCSDEFLHELMDYETQFEGEESLLDNVNQAKELIHKIKFINRKIIEFQSSGLNTQKLVNQKKSLEHELMKKKIIVDNTAKDSDLLTVWKNNCSNILAFVQESNISDMDKAIIDMKLQGASDHITSNVIGLQKTSRRVGVLLKTVKELEYSNAQLADENGFLKQRLSQTDKHFKDLMTKQIVKLESETDNEIERLMSNAKGLNPQEVNKMISRGTGLSMEMEMLENYQQTIHGLDAENKELIFKMETLEDETDDLKEEVTTLEMKLRAEENKNGRRASQMAHPLIKLDSDTEMETDVSRSLTTLLNTQGSGSGEAVKLIGMGNNGSFRGKNQMKHSDRKQSIVPTINVKDRQEMEAVKTENDILRMQLQKLKITVANSRKQTQKKTSGHNIAIQTKADKAPTQSVIELDRHKPTERRRQSPKPPTEAPVEKGERLVKPLKKIKIKKRGGKRKSLKGKTTKHTVEDEFSGESDVDDKEEVEEMEENDIVHEEESYLDEFLDDVLHDEYFNSTENIDDLFKTPIISPVKSGQRPPSESLKHTFPPFESEVDENLTSSIPKHPSAMRESPLPFKPITPPAKPKRQRVKFDEPEEVVGETTPSPEAPPFKRIPTPRVSSANPVKMLSKIRDELKEFLHYGQSFVMSVNECIQITADDELVSSMENYSNLEKRVNEMEIALNILLYGVDLGMSLMAPSQSRPLHSPLPFENKLYFQENLSKYLRAKYPKLNINAIKVFDSDLTPGKTLSKIPSQSRLPDQPFGYPVQQDHSFNEFIPLNTTPEPKIMPPRQMPQSKPRKPTKKAEMCKLEEIMQSLTFGKIANKKKDKEAITDDRTFSEIVEHVMPKEMVMKYLKLIRPTHDTAGKHQYHEKLKRGVVKVKDLLDVVNISPHQSIIKGLPTNKLGEPRIRQTKVHRHSLVVNDIVTGKSSPSLIQYPSLVSNYTAQIYLDDERVRASLDDYIYEDQSSTGVRSAVSMALTELPISARGIMGDGKKLRRITDIKGESEDKGDMFNLSTSNPNIVMVYDEKRTCLPVMTQNLLPHTEVKKALPKKKKVKKLPDLPSTSDEPPPKVSDILNLGWERQKSNISNISQIDPLPDIPDKNSSV